MSWPRTTSEMRLEIRLAAKEALRNVGDALYLAEETPLTGIEQDTLERAYDNLKWIVDRFAS